MATNNTKTSNSRHSPTPLQPTSPASLVEHTNTAPPSHPPLQYDDPQSFRAYAHSTTFDDDDLFSTDDMFAKPTPLPEVEVASIIKRAEQRPQQQKQQQQRTRDYAPVPEHMLANPSPLPGLGIPSIVIHRAEQQQQQQQQQRVEDYPPARGTGLGKTKANPKKRVKFDSPQPGWEERGGGAGALGEGRDGEGGRSQKRVRIDTPHPIGEERGGGAGAMVVVVR